MPPFSMLIVFRIAEYKMHFFNEERKTRCLNRTAVLVLETMPCLHNKEKKGGLHCMMDNRSLLMTEKELIQRCLS